MEEPTDFANLFFDANLFFEKNFSDPANAWRFNKDKAVKNGFKVGVSPISFETFLDLAEEDKDLAKLYIISTDQNEMCLKYSYSHTESGTDSNQNDTPNFKLKTNHKRDPSLTLFVPRPKTDDFKSLDNGDETIYFAINLNDYEFNYSQDENDNFEALVALIRQKKKTETAEFNELVLTTGNSDVGYTLATGESKKHTGGSKRISKHRHTKRRTRGGGGDEELKLNVYYRYGKNYGGEQTQKYNVKFIQKIESKATATIKDKTVTNNTDKHVYIVQILSTPRSYDDKWENIIPNYSRLSILFPNEIADVISKQQNKIKDNDYLPVFPGHNLELLRKIKGFFSKDEIIVSPAEDKYGANNEHDPKFVPYTPAEIQFFKDFYGLASSQEEPPVFAGTFEQMAKPSSFVNTAGYTVPAGFLNPEDVNTGGGSKRRIFNAL